MPAGNEELYQFTQYMETQLFERTAELQSLYSREDFAKIIKKYKAASPDSRMFIRKKLDTMCKAAGIDAEQLLNSRKVLNQIPTREEQKEHLLDIIHDLYVEVPSPTDYMERIVRRLAPEFIQDTVRTAILKQFVKGAGFSCKTIYTDKIREWALDRFDQDEKKAYKKAFDSVKLEMILRHLNDGIFTPEHLVKNLSHAELLVLMIRRFDLLVNGDYELVDKNGISLQLNDVELNPQTADLLEQYCSQHGISINDNEKHIDILRKINDRSLSEYEADDQVAVSIEKDYLKQMNCVFYKKKKGNIGDLNSVANLFKTDKKDEREAKGSCWELLKICDDFANGVFRTNNGMTREHLYWFAIMFDMTVALKGTDAYDPSSDIMKNLFGDYYCDNLIRFLSSTYTDEEHSIFENEPTGEGINFKNYAESIYLYYLYRKDLNLTPGERIDRAVRCINQCKKTVSNIKKYIATVNTLNAGAAGRDAKKAASLIRKIEQSDNNVRLAAERYLNPESKSVNTEVYRRLFVNEMTDLEENQLTDYIISHFQVLPIHKNETSSRMMIASDERTALDLLGYNVEDIENLRDYDVDTSLIAAVNTYPENSEEFKEFINEAAYLEVGDFGNQLGDLLKEKYSEDDRFCQLVDRLKERVRTGFGYIGNNKKQFLARLLRILYHNSSEDQHLRQTELIERIKKTGTSVDAPMLKAGIRMLQECGFEITAATDPKRKEDKNIYFLVKKEYADPLLQEIINVLSPLYISSFEQAGELFGQLLASKNLYTRRITRSMLIAAHLCYYLTDDTQYEHITSFPELYEDFTADLNTNLEDARYQPFSGKNILDMYVILSVYLQIIDKRS